MKRFAVLCLLSFLALLAGCGHQFPQRPFVDTSGIVSDPSPDCAKRSTQPTLTTPERGETSVLHFVEFDDHGWSYDDESTGMFGPRLREGKPSMQLDCAMEHLARELKSGAKVGLYVYVHGWHHNASYGDSDVEKFRRLLHRYGKAERDQSGKDPAYKPRKIIGIYVGWDGKSMDIPYVRDFLTFYPRKAAAHRVAAGRARELFGRIKGLREFHNRDHNGDDCTSTQEGSADNCKFRSVMIGHSFGGLILFSAVQPYLLETLTTQRDLTGDAARIEEPRSRGIADLVVLVNPAFEATLFEPIHRASVNYPERASNAPLLVSLTSTADWAVGRAFEAARLFSSAFHYPANSERQAEAIRDTIGNVGKYRTHYLCLTGVECTPSHLVDRVMPAVQVCDMTVHPLMREDSNGKLSPARLQPIWNVVTTKDLISDHNDIMRDRTISFFEFAYFLNTKGKLPCAPVAPADPVSSLPPAQLPTR